MEKSTSEMDPSPPTSVLAPDEDWPALDLAYAFVLPSYEWALKRYEAVESRLNQLLLVATGLITGIPAVAKALDSNLSLQSPWFYAAAVLAAGIALVGAWVKAAGELGLWDPGVFADPSWRALSRERVQKWAVHYASAHFDQNVTLVNRKGRIATVLTFLFLVEAACLALWLTFALGS